MKRKSGLERRGSGPILGHPVSRPGAVAHARERMPVYSVRSGIAGPAATEFASTGSRIAAYLTDTVILIVALNALWGVVEGLKIQGIDGVTARPSDARWVVFTLLDAAYFIVLWTGGRRTLGMRLFRIRVVRSDDAGPVLLLPAIGRYLVLDIPGILVHIAFGLLPDGAMLVAGLMAVFVGWIWPLVLLVSVARSPSREGIHDRLARTAVVVADR